MVAFPGVAAVLGVIASSRTTFVTLEAPTNEKTPLPALIFVSGQAIGFTPEGSATMVTARLFVPTVSPPVGSPTEYVIALKFTVSFSSMSAVVPAGTP